MYLTHMQQEYIFYFSYGEDGMVSMDIAQLKSRGRATKTLMPVSAQIVS
jgi:hypothetical protein